MKKICCPTIGSKLSFSPPNFSFTGIALLTLHITLTVSCTSQGQGQPPPKNASQITPPTLYVVIDDRSSSTLDVNRPELHHYTLWTNMILRSPAQGAMRVILAGNPKPIHQPTLQWAPAKPIPLPARPTLSERAAIKKQNEAIDRRNSEATEVFLDSVQTRVIHYTAHKNKDHTYLEGPIAQAERIINSTAFKGWRKIILIVSDGKHEDTYGKPKPLPALDKSKWKDSRVFLVGWQNPERFFAGLAYEEVDSIEDFNLIFNVIINK